MSAYYGALVSAFPEGNNFTTEVIAEVLAGIVNANQDYMRYVSYLNPVIETNVTVERLAVFKKKILRPGKRLPGQACKNAEYHRR
ncbi:MAG: hypothetical protein SOX89_06415 [Treponema sp.]|nr:hypothetical protein [Treponema sp.]